MAGAAGAAATTGAAAFPGSRTCARTLAAAAGLFDASSSRARYSSNEGSERAAWEARADSINSSMARGIWPCCTCSSARRSEGPTSPGEEASAVRSVSTSAWRLPSSRYTPAAASKRRARANDSASASRAPACWYSATASSMRPARSQAAAARSSSPLCFQACAARTNSLLCSKQGAASAMLLASSKTAPAEAKSRARLNINAMDFFSSKEAMDASCSRPARAPPPVSS